MNIQNIYATKRPHSTKKTGMAEKIAKFTL